MAGRRLRTTVHMFDAEGRQFTFAAGSTPPDWAVERITNPYVWDTATAPAAGQLDYPVQTQRPDSPVTPGPGEEVITPTGSEFTEGESETDLGEDGVGEDPAAAAENVLNSTVTSGVHEPAIAPDVVLPPTGGPGSGRDVWVDFAHEQGIDVPGKWSRDEIAAAVRRAQDIGARRAAGDQS
jgi:hypothetical protein